MATSVFDALIRFYDGQSKTSRLLRSYLIEVDKDLISDAWKDLLVSFFEINGDIKTIQFDKAEFLKRNPLREKTPYSRFCSNCSEFDPLPNEPTKKPVICIDEVDGYAEFQAKFGDQAISAMTTLLKTAVDDFNKRSKVLRQILEGVEDDEK